jgi:hypothetical protein
MIVLMFMVLNIVTNIRRPLVVGVLSERIQKDQRASVLSVESQLTSVVTAGLSFLIGVLVASLGLNEAFLILGGGLLVGQIFFRV